MSLCCFSKYIYFGLGILALYVGTKIFVKRRWQRILDRWKDTPKDVVIVHGFPPGRTVPNASPFVMKVQTYLRMANIPYQMDHKLRASLDANGMKGKAPWITLNGQHVPDSHFILQFLNKKFEKNLNGNYTEEQLSLAKMVRIVLEEQFYWGLIQHRYVYSIGRLPEVVKLPMPVWLNKLVASLIMSMKAKAQGTGSHSKEEVYQLATESLVAISKLLGNKKFLLGDEPCEDDSAIFGIMAHLLWAMPGAPFEESLNNGDLSNLKEYTIRMKERFWPDWDECLDN